MLDGLGREIDYLRISLTDRCGLRCVYCMPEQGVPPLAHGDLLRYEQIVRLVRIFASLGIAKVRLTGGEPLVRKDAAALAAALRQIEGIETLALTTNGMLLEEHLPALRKAGLDAVNISLDALSEETFLRIARRPGADRVKRAVDAAIAAGLRVKLNCVPTELNRGELIALARFAAERGVPLRFIELMPIGEGKALRGLAEAEVQAMLEAEFGPLLPLENELHAPCRRFSLAGGEVGFISPLSHSFCASCDRVRLTPDGKLKTCLQYGAGLTLRPLLGGEDAAIREAIREAILQKPACHHFGSPSPQDDARGMSQIGG